MSRKRNRHHSLSNTSRESNRSQNDSAKKQYMPRSTVYSTFFNDSQHPQMILDLRNQQKMFNRNISHFRDNFNQNDPSQLPFMSSLRQHKRLDPKTSSTITVCFPFEAALKNTSNQSIKKNVSDFSSKQNRLSSAYYRWHNSSGRNNKWGVDFECSLRSYREGDLSRQKQFYPYVSPIVYKDIETKQYQGRDMICKRHSKSFKIR